MALHQKVRQRGLEHEHEFQPRSDVRTALPASLRIWRHLMQRRSAATYMAVMAGICVVYPAFVDFLFIMGLFYANVFFRQKRALPAKLPRSAKILDPNDLAPDGKTLKRASGMLHLGIKADTAEHIWFTNDDIRTHMSFFATTGGGKAQPDDALVHTPRGWKRMGDIQPGDEITCPDGSVATALNVYPQGEIPIFQLSFHDGRKVEACGNHLWKVIMTDDKGVRSWRTLDTLSIQRAILDGKTVRVPLPMPVEKPEADLPIDPYLLGALLSKGYVGARNQYRKGLGRNHWDVAYIAAKECRRDGIARIITHAIRASKAPLRIVSEGTPGGTARNRINLTGKKGDAPTWLFTSLDAIGLLEPAKGQGCRLRRFIPHLYLEGSIEQRRRLLAGILDARCRSGQNLYEGGWRTLRLELTDKSLVDDIAALVRSLGGFATVCGTPLRYVYRGESRVLMRWAINVNHPRPRWLLEERKLARQAAKSVPDVEGPMIDAIEPSRVASARCLLIDHKEHLYITNDYTVTHNTELLLGLAVNALSWASGFLYVDGKGDTSLWRSVYSTARRFGREDDLLLISFMGADGDGAASSNTMNPYADGAIPMLQQMSVQLMSSSGGSDGMWKDRAISLVEVVIRALGEKRDAGAIRLDVQTIRDYVDLKKLVELYYEVKRDVFEPHPNDKSKLIGKKSGMTKDTEKMLFGFLNTVPGFNWVKAENGQEQEQKTNEQFGFLSMQLTRSLSSLSDSYGHIFRTQSGEVDLYDVVINRRILIVLLPALEKSESEVENLGKIIVANLKSMMGKTLGSRVEGEKKIIFDSRVTNSPSAFLTILDEIGHYTVSGMSTMLAQARSLGFSIVIAAQDKPAMKKLAEKEADSMLANTKINGFGALQDTGETADHFKKMVGEADVLRAAGFESHSGVTTSYFDNRSASIQRVERASLLDLRDQVEGQFHIIYRTSIIRAKTFYPAVKPVSTYRRNHFLKLNPYAKQDMEAAMAMERIAKNLSDPTWSIEAKVKGMGFGVPIADEFAIACVVMSHAVPQLSAMEKSCAAIAAATRLLSGSNVWKRQSSSADSHSVPGQSGYKARDSEEQAIERMLRRVSPESRLDLRDIVQSSYRSSDRREGRRPRSFWRLTEEMEEDNQLTRQSDFGCEWSEGWHLALAPQPGDLLAAPLIADQAAQEIAKAEIAAGAGPDDALRIQGIIQAKVNANGLYPGVRALPSNSTEAMRQAIEKLSLALSGQTNEGR
jgi:TraM recognition site of TraD and TraG